MKTYRIEFLPGARNSLHALFAYISKDNEQAAYAMVDKIEHRVMRLAEQPYLGFELPREDYPMLEPGCRRLVVKPYNIFYRVLEERVVILHIIHERQNLERFTNAIDEFQNEGRQ